MADEGRIIMSDVCVCPVCMNEEHKVDIHMDGDTHLEGSLETVWGAWKVNSAGERYRERIVKNIIVEGLAIPATETEVRAWCINGIYSVGHVILDVSPYDPIDFPLDISPFM